MKENAKLFSIADFDTLKDDENMEFAIARIAVLSTRTNSHKINITEEILRRDGGSILGKWIVADYDKYRDDVTTHTSSEVIVGIIPPDQEPEFVTSEDGEVTMFVNGVISKIYATEVYNLFKSNNCRSMSIEMYTRGDKINEDGTTDIDGLNIFGITILGTTTNGSCPDARMKITRFSADEAQNYYDQNFAKSEALRLADELTRFASHIKKEDNMEEKELSMSEAEEEIVMADETEPKEEEKAEEKEMSCDDKELAEESEEEKDDDSEEEPKADDKELSEESEESEGEVAEDEKEKTMAEQAVEFAEEADKEFVEKLFSADLSDMVKVVCELKAFKDAKVKEDTTKKFNSIMLSVKCDLNEENYTKLFEEGATLSLDELDAFENKCKAFAYEDSKASKKSKRFSEEPEIMTFGCNDVMVNQREESVDEMFARINAR